VELVQGERAARALRVSRCSNAVATIHASKAKFVGIGSNGFGLVVRRHVFMDALHHAVKLLGRLVLVGEDVRPAPEVQGGVVVEPGCRVGGDAELAGFEDDRPNAAGVEELVFEAGVQDALGFVPLEGLSAPPSLVWILTRLAQ
jgi:hypothetical protein